MTELIDFQRKAREKFSLENKANSFTDPLLFLYSLDWDISAGPQFSEDVLAIMNVNLDERGCFGRAVKAAVLSTELFPSSKIFSAEVCEDFFRAMLINDATASNWRDPTYIAEILQYENPHQVIICDGRQFDPLFKDLMGWPQELKHPVVLIQDLWAGLHCSYLVSEALLDKTNNPQACISQLYRALSLYPSNILVKENLAALHASYNDFSKATFFAREVLKFRKDAKTLFFLWILTNDEAYKRQIIAQYNPAMFNYLNSVL